MRYIGNKTKLVPFIRETLRTLRIPAGTAHDAFAGTVAVGRALKEDGWRVMGSDLMMYSYVFQRAYLVAPAALSFARLLEARADVRRSVATHRRGGGRSHLEGIGRYLSHDVPPRQGTMWKNFSPAGGRMYFTEENAARIDAVRAAIDEWRAEGLVDEHAFYVLLAALIEAADRVANTAGVYAAYIKTWQANALKPLGLEPVRPKGTSRGTRAYLGDAIDAAQAMPRVDLLYVDPPYNSRQYGGYYHIPELIASGAPATELRGRTGLPSDGTVRSAWCAARSVRSALGELLKATRARHALLSYNSEGLLPTDELEDILREHARGAVRRFVQPYKRYRADSDHSGRRYRTNDVYELLYHIRLR